MDPVTWATALRVLQKYWWVVLLVGVLIYVQILRLGIKSRDSIIDQQKQIIVLKIAELDNYRVKLDVQNNAIEDMAQKGKEQAARLDGAIKRVNDMKPATQVIIREIYKDSAKDANDLLFNAIRD